MSKKKLFLEFNHARWEEKTSPVLMKSKKGGLKLPRLRLVREQRGVSQRQLSSALGRNHDWIGAVERGCRGVGNLSGAEEIADALGVHPADLTTHDALQRYLSPENLRGNNAAQQRVSNPPKKSGEAGGVLGKVFALFARPRI